ncbi:MAG: hypothetical protein RL217_1425 [Pseudomonadota bacterium]
MKKIVFIVIVLLSVASLFYFTNYLVNPCDEILIDKVLSDDTRFSASIYSVDCGATTSSAKKVFISDSNLNESIEIFVADNVDDIKIKWVEKDILSISFSSARVFLKRDFHSFGQRKIFFMIEEKE